MVGAHCGVACVLAGFPGAGGAWYDKATGAAYFVVFGVGVLFVGWERHGVAGSF